MPPQCTACGGQRLEPGRLASMGDACFLPRHSRFLLLSSAVRLDACVCLDCGHLMLRVDPEQVQRKLRPAQPD